MSKLIITICITLMLLEHETELHDHKPSGIIKIKTKEPTKG